MTIAGCSLLQHMPLIALFKKSVRRLAAMTGQRPNRRSFALAKFCHLQHPAKLPSGTWTRTSRRSNMDAPETQEYRSRAGGDAPSRAQFAACGLSGTGALSGSWTGQHGKHAPMRSIRAQGLDQYPARAAGAAHEGTK